VRFNLATFLFLDQAAVSFYRERPHVMRNSVALLRAAAARTPHDADLTGLIRRLASDSAEFRELWAAQDVLRYRDGTKRLRNPLVGELNFSYQSFAVPAKPELSMVVYTSAPDSSTSEGVQLLASWSTPDSSGHARHGTPAS
jgi:hypothetical protein